MPDSNTGNEQEGEAPIIEFGMLCSAAITFFCRKLKVWKKVEDYDFFGVRCEIGFGSARLEMSSAAKECAWTFETRRHKSLHLYVSSSYCNMGRS
jgi:hypothetical protein